MKKILLCMMLALLIATVMMPVTASALKHGDFTFEIIENTSECRITGYMGSSNTVVIPDAVSTDGSAMYLVTEIGQYAFSNSGIETVLLPSGLKMIAPNAFSENPISTIEFPSDLEIIDISAFSNCALTSVTIPSKVKYIGNNAFYAQKDSSGNPTLINVTFEKDSMLERIDHGAFGDNAISSIELPPSLESIGQYAFSGNKITNLIIPANVGSIEENAFSSNDIENLSLPKGLVYIGPYAFANNGLFQYRFAHYFKLYRR